MILEVYNSAHYNSNPTDLRSKISLRYLEHELNYIKEIIIMLKTTSKKKIFRAVSN
jgi:hypothetical protein